MGPAEKFECAVCALASSGPIKDRVTAAWRKHLALIEEKDLPQELREEFLALKGDFTRERPLTRGEDACWATVRKMSNDQADTLACRVVRLFAAISREEPQRMRAAKALGSQVVPLFAAEA